MAPEPKGGPPPVAGSGSRDGKPIFQLLDALESGAWHRAQAIKGEIRRQRVSEGTSAGLRRSARIMREARWAAKPSDEVPA